MHFTRQPGPRGNAKSMQFTGIFILSAPLPMSGIPLAQPILSYSRIPMGQDPRYAYVWNTTGAINFDLFQEPYGPGPQVFLCTLNSSPDSQHMSTLNSTSASTTRVGGLSRKALEYHPKIGAYNLNIYGVQQPTLEEVYTLSCSCVSGSTDMQPTRRILAPQK